jgi:hypothetical protein
VAAYRARHPLGTRARLALELLTATCAAKADATRLGRQHMRGDVLLPPRQNRGRGRHPGPARVRGRPRGDAARGPPHLHRDREGRELHGDRLRQLVPRALQRGRDPGRLVGARGAATRHADRGATAHELMAWFGWLTIREAERYTKTAARKKRALGLKEKLT